MRDFSHTVNILVKAFLNDTLIQDNCGACAVGNIVGGEAWRYLFVTPPDGDQYFYKDDDSYLGENTIHIRAMRERGRKLIAESGYELMEMARIENAFEKSEGEDKADRMFNGLMNVVDVLADIHGIDLKAKEEAKLLFVKA